MVFARVVRGDGGEPGPERLAQAALLIAEPFYPELDIPYYLGVLDKLADEARRRVAGLDPFIDGEQVARRLVRLLFEEVGFAGNSANYHDPKNSFLNEVLDRRLGLPITLAVVLVEVARRAGLRADGVGFPQHFLARMPGRNGPVIIDAFEGRVLDPERLRALNQRVFGRDALPEPRQLQPATELQILSRMLTNLRLIYQSRSASTENRDALRAVLERLLILRPEDSELPQAIAALDAAEPPPGAN